MKTWRFESGDLIATASGETLDAAFLAAIKKYNPESLGLLVEAVEQTADDAVPVYADVERILRRAGIFQE